MTEKPPYSVPSMRDIEKIPWNGFNAISTFSGCGGSSLGYRMAGFRVLWANEFIPAAADTYRANRAPYTILDTRDIRKIKPEEILSTIGMKPGELDLFDGSPPCASFSLSGSREAGWGKAKKYSDTVQRTDDLFFEFTRILAALKPKTFVAENVAGLVVGSAKGYFIEILNELKKCGYKVKCKLLDAQWLGVPQRRKRAIFVGVRNDLDPDPVHPVPFTYRYILRDAVPDIEKPTQGYKPMTGKTYEQWAKLKVGEQSKKYFNLIRTSPNEPCPTILASAGHPNSAGVTHPFEPRKFNMTELRSICSFPPDFVLTGTPVQQWERLGRSVPPVMMSHIAKAIQTQILEKLK